MARATPPFLSPGDTVVIIATAKQVGSEVLVNAKKQLESFGFNVELGANSTATDRYFAGTIAERVADLQWAMDHPEAKAILCARGGYGTVHLLKHLSWDSFIKQPKWLVGFSDITVLHNQLNQLGIASIHGTVPLNYPNFPGQNESLNGLINLLQGSLPSYVFNRHKLNREGSASGKLVGGNLAIIQSLAGSFIDLNTTGAVLFLEDVGEYDYQLDRMLWNLKIGGKLDQLAGLVLGGFTDIAPGSIPLEQSPAHLIREICSGFDFPIAFDFPAGHQDPNMPLVLGEKVYLDVHTNTSYLSWEKHTTLEQTANPAPHPTSKKKGL